MPNPSDCLSPNDPFNLSRFLEAQEDCYQQALLEIRSGRKRSHWMWFIFPQFEGLALSSTSRHYAIKSAEEAKAYLDHAILGSRLLECIESVMGVESRSVREIFGAPDDLKLKSCATLFACVSSSGSVFESLLEKFYSGERDAKTLELLGVRPGE
ncbi:MAG: DUF1810 domain-containing protein [Armatimonadetes bacterium]|nr:DUF1810 domain-containing protein [Armatimonadota bacterium]